MDRERLNRLLDHYLDGALTAEEKAELEQMLLAYPQARATFWEATAWNAALRESGTQSWGKELLKYSVDDTAAADISHRRAALYLRRVCYIAGAIAALIALSFYFVRTTTSKESQITEAVDERLSDAVAVLTQTLGARWESAEPIKVGATLQPGTLKLSSGIAQIEFFSGGSAVLEGPAELKLVSPGEAFLVTGKVRVHVPPQARGFRVRSSATDVVDLGTEFGMSTGTDSGTVVQVFDGKVELYKPGAANGEKPTAALTEGRSIRVDAAGGATQTTPDPEFFVSAAEFTRRASSRIAQISLARHDAVLKFAPDLVVYYDFQPQQMWDRVLNNASAQSIPGALVGTQWAEGRIAGTHALDFRRVGDRICLNVPGEFESFTLMASVRVDSYENRYSGIFMSDDFNTGAIHWQIAREGTITLGVQGPNNSNGINYTTPAVLTSGSQGQWVSLAVVVDKAHKTVTHFVDGRIVCRQPLTHTVSVRPGKAQLGNWGHSLKWKSVPVRNFNGRMDEFLLCKTALSDADVEALSHLHE